MLLSGLAVEQNQVAVSTTAVCVACASPVQTAWRLMDPDGQIIHPEEYGRKVSCLLRSQGPVLCWRACCYLPLPACGAAHSLPPKHA